MSRRSWTAKDDARLRELYPVTRTSELPAMLGRSRSAIRNRATSLHLRKDPSVSMRRPWHPDEDAVVRMLFADTPTDAVAAVLGRSLSSTFQRAWKLGLRKSPEYLASPDACRLRRGDHPGKAFQFRKGHVPANKGLRRPGYAPGRMRETQFIEGQATNWKPVGSTREVDGYVYRKVSDVRNVPWTVNWKPEHVLMWERVHGPVPKGQALAFKNGDKADIRVDNLELITRGELMLRNTIHRYPPDIVQAVQLIGAVKRKINRRLRNEEQDRRSA